MAEKIAGEWLFAPETASVMGALAANGATARFVGGCVRDALLERRVSDVDIATDANPNTVAKVLAEADIKVIPTGLSHGTLTAVKGERSYEITTLREDTHTDGRRAEVKFTKDWKKDASRRDFTMNALYADMDGRVHDVLGSGIADTFARRIRFIGSPSDRIQEDFLRILRLFRFHAHYGEGGMEPDALVACAGLTGGLELLSRERVGSEILKMFDAHSPALALDMMEQTGVLIKVLPTARTGAPMTALEGLERRFGLSPDPIRRLALVTRGSDPRETGRALRLSNNHMAGLRARAAPPAFIKTTEDARRLGYERGQAAGKDTLFIQHTEDNSIPDVKIIKALDEGADQKLPVSPTDLMAIGIDAGPALGEMLKKVEKLWVDSDFVMDKATLIGEARV
jgi:poly(A) polymerase